jgi:drug/metabolite transporter (DMT)-like permease
MPVMDIILLLILSAIWGSSFIFMRYLAPLIGPIATADMRMFIAGVCLVVFFAIIRFSPQWRKNWKHFLVIGLLNSAVPFVLYSVAALYLPASMEAIFNSLSPMFGAIFAALWLGETLTARKLIGLVMGIAGVAVMSSLGSVTASVSTALAIAACLLAVPPRAIAGGSQLLGGIALMPFLFLDPPPLAAISLPLVLLVLAFAVLCSAVAYLIYYRLIADVGPTKALTVTFLIPVFAMLWGAMFLGEGVTASIVAGAAIILVGTFLVAAPRRRPVSAGG